MTTEDTTPNWPAIQDHLAALLPAVGLTPAFRVADEALRLLDAQGRDLSPFALAWSSETSTYWISETVYTAATREDPATVDVIDLDEFPGDHCWEAAVVLASRIATWLIQSADEVFADRIMASQMQADDAAAAADGVTL